MRTLTFLVVLFCSALLPAGASANSGTVFLLEKPGVYFRVSILARLPSNQQLIPFALKSLDQHRSETIVRLAYYTQESDARAAESPKESVHIELHQWEKRFSEEKRNAKAALEIVRIGDWGTVRTYDGYHTRGYVIPGLRDLSATLSSKASLNFLEVTVEAHKPMFMSTPFQEVQIFLLYRDEFSSQELKAVVERLHISRVPWFRVAASDDPRYLIDTSYPYFDRFVTADINASSENPTTYYCSKSESQGLECGR